MVAKQKGAARVEANKCTLDPLAAGIGGAAFANWPGSFNPSLANACKPCTALPDFEPALQRGVKPTEHHLRRHANAMFGQMRGGPPQIRRVPCQINTNADHCRYAGFRHEALRENARALCLPDQDIVRPLEPQSRQG